jgi:hypothetical protein
MIFRDFGPTNLELSVLLALFSAWLVLSISLRRLKGQKHFRLRLDASVRVVEALRQMQSCCEKRLHTHSSDPIELERLRADYSQAHKDLQRAADRGRSLFSASTNAVLSSLIDGLASIDISKPTAERLQEELEVITATLGYWQSTVKRELKV